MTVSRYQFVLLGGERHCESKVSCPRTQRDLLLVTILQSPTDNQDNLLKKLTNYMKEKDRALQVGYVCFDFFFLTLIFNFTTR